MYAYLFFSVPLVDIFCAHGECFENAMKVIVFYCIFFSDIGVDKLQGCVFRIARSSIFPKTTKGFGSRGLRYVVVYLRALWSQTRSPCMFRCPEGPGGAFVRGSGGKGEHMTFPPRDEFRCAHEEAGEPGSPHHPYPLL